MSEIFLALFESTNLPRELCHIICKMVFKLKIDKFKMDNFSQLFARYKTPTFVGDWDKTMQIHYDTFGKILYGYSLRFADKTVDQKLLRNEWINYAHARQCAKKMIKHIIESFFVYFSATSWSGAYFIFDIVSLILFNPSRLPNSKSLSSLSITFT